MKNPRLLQTTKTMLATVALTGLMSGSAVRLHAASTSNGPDQMNSGSMGQMADSDDKGKHDCKGKNSCKGEGGCKSGDQGCKGKNTCKGKGGCKSGM